MSDILTQEEINALLAGTDSSEQGALNQANAQGAAPFAVSPSSEASPSGFSPEALRQLSEVAKLSLGATSSVVQVLLNKEVAISLKQIKDVSFSEMAAEGGSDEYIIAKISCVEGFDGNFYLMLKKNIAAVIGDLMMGGSGVDIQFQDMHTSAVCEMLNQMMGKTTTSLSEIFKKRVDISPPDAIVASFNDGPPKLPDFSETAHFLKINYTLKIGDVADTEIVQLLPVAFAKLMAEELTKPKEQQKAAPPPPPPPQNPFGAAVPPNIPPQIPGMGPQIPGMQNLQGAGGLPVPPPIPGMGMLQGAPAQFGNLQMPMGLGLQSNIDLLLDVPLQITVELGRTRMLIKDVLELGIGSVVELNKLAGEPVEVLVNNKLLAKGEVVVIDENFAVRITSIINPQDRLEGL